MRRLAFTLIEVLVVIVIIGILAVITVPQISRYQNQAENARREALVANVAKIIIADEFISLDGVNFADLDADTSWGQQTL